MKSLKPRTNRRLQKWAICSAVAAILLRGLIPVGYMPADGNALRHGTPMMLCPHSDGAAHAHDANAQSELSNTECPFCAADCPALPSLWLSLNLVGPGHERQRARRQPVRIDLTSLMHPPPRGPPAA